jgi:hypothetical protein
LEFKVGDQIFLKVSPMKRVFQFDKKGKLNPRYVGPVSLKYWLMFVSKMKRKEPSVRTEFIAVRT